MKRSTDREKVIKGLDICVNGGGCKDGIPNPLCPYSSVVGCDLNQILLDALTLLKEQEQEISFLKAMQLQTVKGMDERELGEIVGKTLGLWR